MERRRGQNGPPFFDSRPPGGPEDDSRFVAVTRLRGFSYWAVFSELTKNVLSTLRYNRRASAEHDGSFKVAKVFRIGFRERDGRSALDHFVTLTATVP